MPTTIQEALQGKYYKDVASLAGLPKSTAYFMCTGRSHFCSPETAQKIKGALGIDLSGFVRKPDQKIPRKHKRWSKAAKQRLRRSRAQKRVWQQKKANGSAVETEVTLMAVRYSKHFCFVINSKKGTVLGKAIILNPEEM